MREIYETTARTGPLYDDPDLIRRRDKTLPPALTAESFALLQLHDVELELTAIRYRLLGVHSTLPPGKGEVDRELDLEDESSMSGHLRAVIETLLEDKIEPALRDLRALEGLPEMP
ncbi:MAG TPA: hypothetical protein VIC28_06135 [Thermoanaerobaculia bacterium]